MELAGPICGVASCLWGCARPHALHVFNLNDHLKELDSKWDDLDSSRRDVKRRVVEAENTGEMRRKDSVQNWLDKVDDIHREIRDIHDELGRPEIENKCLSSSYWKNCVSCCKLGKKVKRTLVKVEALIRSGKDFDNSHDVAYKLPRGPADDIPVDETVALDSMLDTVWNCIKDENVGIIGLHGMGGAGKTTLLERINNEFGKQKHDFAMVMWVEVSKDHDTDRIMNDIRCWLEIDDVSWNKSNPRKRVAQIHKVLKGKKFVLLLDDLWEALELNKVGIPLLGEAGRTTNYESKVVFTTRAEDVCQKMKAQRSFKVECLRDSEAFELFCMKVGRETLESHRRIPELAREMAKECEGLPLALVTVGSAMAGVKSIQAWEDAKNDLRSSPFLASDFQKNVFSILKFSYDRLPEETHRKCFLYCALYPADYKINVPDLIYRWISEGFLGNQTESIDNLYGHGESVIERLKLSSLLESDEGDLLWNRRVKMHDVIRDMAIWLSHDQDQNRSKILVQKNALSVSQTRDEKWNVVERISVTDCEEDLHIPTCSGLLTLIASRNGSITGLENVKSMDRLKVLDLSCNRKELKLPAEIGDLIHLEYLNLSESRLVSMLPIELKKLKNLRIFLLLRIIGCTLGVIPLEVISSLEQLKEFRFSEFKPKRSQRHKEERAFLEKLDSLPNLEELWIELGTYSGLKKLFEPAKLQSCLRFLLLSQIETQINMPSLLETMSKMKHLEGIKFIGLHFSSMDDGLSMTETYHFGKLCWVDIYNCYSITHLTWLKYAPLLEILWVDMCDSMEEVIKEDEDNMENIFSNLAYLYLGSLPKLKSIHKTALPFPCLKYIQIHECPNLKKLPFDSCSTIKDSLSVREIRGSQEWHRNLEWENPTTEQVFASKLNIVTKEMLSQKPTLEDSFSPFGYNPHFEPFSDHPHFRMKIRARATRSVSLYATRSVSLYCQECSDDRFPPQVRTV